MIVTGLPTLTKEEITMMMMSSMMTNSKEAMTALSQQIELPIMGILMGMSLKIILQSTKKEETRTARTMTRLLRQSPQTPQLLVECKLLAISVSRNFEDSSFILQLHGAVRKD